MAQIKANDNRAGRVKPTKMDAVRQALRMQGEGAKAADIQKFVKDTFGMVMTIDHVYNCMSEIRKQAKKRGPAKSQGKKGTAPAPTPAVAQNRQPTGGGGISLADLAAAKGLLERVGPEKVRSLIDILAR